MKHLCYVGVVALGFLSLTSNVNAADNETVSRHCDVEHFIGTGETMNLSFTVCEDVLASPTFLDNFRMECQQGLVTYKVKNRPSAKYLRLGNDGSPVHCSST